ncbi:MAG: DUF2721 domain-containing protein [Thermoanaerobaculia bacterium]|nr:DUF2721 domain-containing protein [Thermoanaerobaculia bacterium]
MDPTSFSTLLQISISPMVLISGVGLLLLSATNRLGRAIDRTRIVNRIVRESGESPSPSDQRQLRVLFRRCLILQWVIGLLVFSILCSGIMILLLVVSTFASIDLSIGVSILTLNVISIVASVVLFLADITFSLEAIRIEIGHDQP